MKKYIFLVFLSFFAEIGTIFAQGCNTAWNTTYGDKTNDCTTDICAGSVVDFKPICIDVFGNCSVTSCDIDDASAGTLTASSAPGYSYAVSFNKAGTFKVTAYYRCINTLFPASGPQYYYHTRCIYFRVADTQGASRFNLALNNICASPVTSVTLNRVQPNNTLYSYEIKLFQVVSNVATQVWSSGYTLNTFGSYTIDNTKYAGFVPGRTYRVDLFAKADNTAPCGDIDNSTSSRTFTVDNTPVLPKFDLQGGVLVQPAGFQEFTLCNASTAIMVKNASTAPSCAPITAVEFGHALLQYGSCSAGIIYSTLSSAPGSNQQAPAATYNIRAIMPQIGQTAGYWRIFMRVKTAYGWSNWGAPQCIRTIIIPPNNGLVNFGFAGSSQADLYGNYACGTAAEQETAPVNLGGSCTSGDGWLSNGGTATNPTWAGAYFTQISGLSINNFTGGLVSHTIEIFDVGAGRLIGTFNGGSTFQINTNINEIRCAYSGTPISNFFLLSVQSNAGVFNNKTFRVRGTGKDVCGNVSFKDGYFKIIPNNAPNSCTICRSNGQQENFEAAGDKVFQANTMQLSPNPVAETLQITFESEAESVMRYQIIGIDGREWWSENGSVQKGTNDWKANVGSLPAGTYLLRVVTDNSTETRKFIKID